MYAKIIKAVPSEKDYTAYFSGIEVEIYNEKRTTIFSVSIRVILADIIHGENLGADSITYTMGVATNCYHNKRKYKITRSDYDFKNSKKVFIDPSFIFPKAKIKKIFSTKTKRKFSKRDMLLFLTKNLNSEKIMSNNVYRIPIKDDLSIDIFRRTISRVGYWIVMGVGNKNQYGKLKNSYMFEENESLMDDFSNIKNELKKLKDQDSMTKKLTNMLDQMSKEKTNI